MKHFDGWLYAVIAISGSITISLGSDEAFNQFDSKTLFWAKTICGSISAGALAVKMYRSTTYARAGDVASPAPELPITPDNSTKPTP